MSSFQIHTDSKRFVERLRADAKALEPVRLLVLRHRTRLLRLVAVGVAAAAYALAPTLAALPSVVRHASPAWLAAGAAAEALSALSYVVAFRAIYSSRISWASSYEIAMAGQAANSALPANGVGGLAFGAWALRRSGLGAERIARGTVAFFMLTSLGNILMLFVFGGALTLHLAGRDPAPALTLGFLGAGLAVIAGALALPPAMACLRGAARGRPGMVRHAVSRLLDAVTGGVTESIHVLRRRPLGVIGGTAGYLAFDIACLGVCFRAVGHPPPPTILMVGYLIGQMGGALPVPGGIGAVEGGLIGAFVVYGTPLPEATAAVLAYRVFSMCVPVLLGGHALMRLRRSMRAAQGGTALAAAAATAVGGHPGKP